MVLRKNHIWERTWKVKANEKNLEFKPKNSAKLKKENEIKPLNYGWVEANPGQL